MDPDRRLLEWVAAHRTETLTEAARLVMAGGGSRALAVGLAVVFVLGIVFGRTAAVWLAVASGGSASVVATALKALVDRPRPPADLALVAASGTSMPSTIAALTAGASIAFALALRSAPASVRRVASVVLVLLVVLVGAAMVYLGAHWASDVLVGWLIGAVAAVILAVPYRRLARH